MTLPQYKHTFNGQSLYQDDLNLLGRSSSRGGDEALKHIARNTGRIGRPSVQRGLMLVEDATIIASGPSGITNGPFTAWIGAETADFPDGYGSLRSVFVPGDSFTFTVPPIVGGERIDMIVARYTPRIESPPVERAVKAPVTGVVTSELVHVSEQDEVTFEYLQGPDAGVPSWPADPVGAYYIPIALIYRANETSAAGTFPSNYIEVVADIRTAQNIAPASMCFSNIRHAPGDSRDLGANFGAMRRESMPTSISGVVERLIPVRLDGATFTGKLIDDSIDWRDRLFCSTLEFRGDGVNSTTTATPWQQGYATGSKKRLLAAFQYGSGDAEPVVGIRFGQSLRPVGGVNGFPLTRYVCMLVDSGDAAHLVYLYVDDAGALRCTANQALWGSFFVWMRATSQYTGKEP